MGEVRIKSYKDEEGNTMTHLRADRKFTNDELIHLANTLLSIVIGR